ncbi:MAG: type II secretion system protein GspG [Candidatus Paceibacterota bacterium]|jgi:hypothetical protein
MEEIKSTNDMDGGVGGNMPVGGSKKAPVMTIILIILAVILFAGKDIIYSEYSKLFSARKTETPIKEENNFIKDTYLNQPYRADDVMRKSNIAQIGNALEMFFLQNGSYPVSLGGTKLNDENSAAYQDLIKYVNSSNLKDSKDPEFFYLYRSDGKSYEITARLENIKDPECKISDDGFCIYKISKSSAN